jgi:hypothetical protein
MAPATDDRFTRPWFDAKTARDYVPCKSLNGWYQWRRRHGIVARGNGSVAKKDIDRALLKMKTRGGGAARHPASLANLEKSPKRRGATESDSDRETKRSPRVNAAGLTQHRL